MVDLQFIEQTGMKDYNDYEQYHFDWVYKLECEGFKFEAI